MLIMESKYKNALRQLELNCHIGRTHGLKQNVECCFYTPGITEDCLYLNVYTKNLIKAQRSSSYVDQV